MTPAGYSEDALVDINPDSVDVRVASGLLAGLRDWNVNTPETLRLIILRQGRLAPSIPKEAGA